MPQIICKNGAFLKNGGLYGLKDFIEFKGSKKSVEKTSGIFLKGRMRKGLILIALLVFSSVSGYVLAALLSSMPEQYIQPAQKPILGNFTMALDIYNVKDLYAWQVVITFNSSELEFIEVSSGGFVGKEFPFIVKAADVGEGLLVLGGTLYGNSSGRTGSGRLAKIVFGYFTETYTKPMMVQKMKFYETKLLTSNGSKIPFEFLEATGEQTYLKLTPLQG